MNQLTRYLSLKVINSKIKAKNLQNFLHHSNVQLFNLFPHEKLENLNFHTSTKQYNSQKEFSKDCSKLRQDFETLSGDDTVNIEVLQNLVESVGKLHHEFMEHKLMRFSEEDERQLIACWFIVIDRLIYMKDFEGLSNSYDRLYELGFEKYNDIRLLVGKKHSTFIVLCGMRDLERRDLEIKKLYNHYHGGKFGPIIKTPRIENVWHFPKLEGSFLRDSLAVKNCAFHLEEPQDVIVLVYEFHDLLGEKAIKNVFVVYDSNLEYLYRFSIGTYQNTHDIVKEFKTMELLDNERAFHLDFYYKDGHQLFGMCQGPEESVSLPFYDKVKQGIIDLLSGNNFDMESCCNK